MNKILVLVYVPLFEQEYDVMIPINQKIGAVKHHIVSIINEIIGHEYLNDNNILYDKETCAVYENDMYVKDAGIKNGSQLMVI